MAKNTIFGHEHFIDKNMVNINHFVDNYIYDEITKTLKVAMPHIIINKERVIKWAELCLKLENIEMTDLIDMATKKKFADMQDTINSLDYRLNVLSKDYSSVTKNYNELILKCEPKKE